MQILKIAVAIGVTILVHGASPFGCFGQETIDFRTQIMPVLTKHGCNAGACHGSAAGRGGLRLSLYGSRPVDDYHAIVHADKGRRINRVDASKSLILRKPGGEMEHGGDQRFHVDDPAGALLSEWIQQGAKIDNRSSQRKLKSFGGNRPTLIFDRPGQKHEFKFIATFSDNTIRDVTQWTVLTSNDESSVSVDSSTNSAHIKRQGRHVLIARYMNQVSPIEIIVPFENGNLPIQWKTGENFVDDHVYEKLNQLRLAATEKTDDNEFIRRLSLDLRGRLPLPDEVDRFVENDAPNKRSGLISRYLSSDDYVDYYTLQLAQQLRVRSQPADKIGAKVFGEWLRFQVRTKQSWREMVGEMLPASGDTHLLGAPNFMRVTSDARLQAEFVSESLMGVTLRCANCHDHPFDHWTQDDYHGLAAIFAKTRQGRIVEANPGGENMHPVTNLAARPRLPGDRDLADAVKDPREILGEWLVSDKNLYFAKAKVNRIWKSLMGRGLVEPVDDLRYSNPATHPHLLNELAQDFIRNDFDVRHTTSQICNSDAYQRKHAAKNGRSQTSYYGAATARRLPPEVLLDAIRDVLGTHAKLAGRPNGTRAIRILDSKTPSFELDILGRCSREESCESDHGPAMVGLATQLHLMNGPLLNQRLASESNMLNRMIATDKSTEEIVRYFYKMGYSREPEDRELEFWIKKIDSNHSAQVVLDRDHRLEDFVWSLLNSKEFYSNH